MFVQNQSFKDGWTFSWAALLAVTSAVVLYESAFLFLSALIGVGTACLLAPLITRLENRWKIPRFAAALAILSGIALAFAGLFLFAGSIIVEQFEAFAGELPQIMGQWETRWERMQEEYPRIAGSLSGKESVGLAKSGVVYAGKFFSAVLSAATGLTLAAVIALFSSVNSQKYFKGFVRLFPEAKQQIWKHRCKKAAEILRKWFFAQFLDMCIVGALTTFGLWIVGIKYWALYGLMTGILSLLPFVGIIIVVTFAAGVVAVEQPDRLLWLAIVFGVTQQLEGNYILPKLMKEHVQIPAAPLIFLMLLAGTWLGPLGIFVTPPLLAIGIYNYRNPNLSET